MSFGIDSWLQSLLWASFYGAVLAAAMLLMQMALRRHVPARWRFVLWLIVLVRFVPMAGVESRWSPFNWLPHAQGEQKRESHPQGAPAGVAPVADALPHAPDTVAESKIVAPIVASGAAEAIATSQVPVEARRTALAATAAPMIISTRTTAGSPISFWSLVYGIGAGIVVMRLLLATASLARIVRRSSRVEDASANAMLRSVCETMKVRRTIPLLVTDDLASPAVVGFFQPKLLLPRGLIGRLTPDELRLVFLHEAAHIRRRDVLLNYVLAALEAVHWFNPVAWMMAGRIRAERELACDEMVLLHTGDPAPYGHTLLKLLQTAGSARSLAPAVGIVETRTFFARRIRMIAQFQKRPAWIALPVILAAAAAASCALTAPVTRAENSAATPAPVGGPTTPSPAAAGATAVPGAASKPSETVATTGTSHDLTPQAQALIKLDAVMRSLKADNQSLEKVLDYFADQTGLNVHVNWNALQEVGVDRNTPISANLEQISARKELQLILADAGGGYGKVDFVVDEGVVSISTQADIQYIRSHAKDAVDSDGGLAQANAKRYAEASLMVNALTQQLQELKTANAPDGQRDAVQRQILMAQAMLADISRQPMPSGQGTLIVPAQSPPAVAAPDAAVDAIKAELAMLDAQRSDLSQKFGPQNPQLQAVEQNIKALQSRLYQIAQDREKAVAAQPATTLHVYDVHDLLDVPATQQGVLTTDQQSALRDLVTTVQTTLKDPAMTVSAFNGMLVVKATDAAQNEVQNVLRNLMAIHAEHMDEVKDRLQKEAAEKHFP